MIIARRRAVLALARHSPADAEQIAEQLVVEADPYMRLAAVEMAGAIKNNAVRQRVLHTLSADSEELVRQAARRKLI